MARTYDIDRQNNCGTIQKASKTKLKLTYHTKQLTHRGLVNSLDYELYVN